MRSFAVAFVIALGGSNSIPGAELRADSLQAWDRYLQHARARMDERATGARPFLWVQESQDRTNRLVRGGISVEPMDASGRVSVPGALIHHWIGAELLPGTTAERVLSKLDRYEDYHEFYKPTVVRSTLLGRDGNETTFSLRWQEKTAFVDYSVDADYECLLWRRAPGRWWSVSRSTRVQEIEHPGRSDERIRPTGIGAGYIWHLCSMTRVMNVDGGAIVEVEAIALSRSVPFAVAWFVNPVISRLSRNALARTLIQTREAVAR